MEKFDVVIVGGSAAGIVTATTGKRAYPDKRFLVIRKDDNPLVPCGIPYIFLELGTVEKNYMPGQLYQQMGIELFVDEVVRIDRTNKLLHTRSGREISYEKLVLALGSKPYIPSIKGVELENVFTVSKDANYLAKMKEKLSSSKRIVVVGAGFIGVEVSEQLALEGKEVVLVEIMPHILSKAFDGDIARFPTEEFEKLGVKIMVNTKILEIKGNSKVEAIIFEKMEKK